MEENNPQQNFSQLCKMGCGYFGSSNFDGLCSQCYKDKEKQFENNHTLNSTNYPAYSEKEKEFNDVQDSLISDIETESLISSTKASLATSSSTSSFNSLVTGDTNKSDILNSESNTVTSANSVKKNRCQLCRKKVGLTGFMCRCGGMFCCAHRYSDSHSCTFDYKIEAENAIRKANPRIVSNKVPKI